MTFRQVAFHDHRNVVFIPLALLTSAFAVRPDSTMLPLIATLSVLLVYSPFLFRSVQPHRFLHISVTWIAISLGTPLSRLHASLDALSNPGGSVAALFLLSAILSGVTIATLYVSTKFHAHSSSSWGQVTFFPALWATIWWIVSYINPVGHLATWTVVDNRDAYDWLLPLLGPTSKDWITAAWAVVISQTVGQWYIGFQDLEDEIDLLNPQPNHSQPSGSNMTATRSLALFLVLLTVPSFVIPTLPLPASLSTIRTSTPLGVGCVLPSYERYKHHILTLDDYIVETDKIRNYAKIVLWPEGAVTFRSVEEREEGFAEVRRRIKDGTYVGVAFEEVIGEPSDPSKRRSLTRTGLAIVSSNSNDTHHVYYKRHLVPFVESFRLRHSALPPTIVELPLKKPSRNVKHGDWAPTTNNSRPIPVTSSICLDFAAASPFAELDSRPALILAPARTWDVTVGYAMWLQAKQRAEELGTMVLWCDGGEGGVSGVAGNGYNDVSQVGSTSFARTIGVQYPFDTRETLFARFGGSVLIIFWLSVLGPGILRRMNSGYTLPLIHSVMQYVRTGRSGHTQGEATAQPNLLDL